MDQPTPLQDAHLHLQDTRLARHLPEIIATAQSAGVSRCVVNGTGPDDWPLVTALKRQFPDFVIPSYGLHPWKTPTADQQWKTKLLRCLDSSDDACIGECGLDRWMDSPNRAAQEEAFRFQLKLASERNLPISIHVLKAWGWLMDVLTTSDLPERGFLLHSYSGSHETATQLYHLGGYFSFSGYFLDPRKSALQETFRKLPLERILLETDAPDMLPPEKFIHFPLLENLNHPANLPAISGGLSRLLIIDEVTMREKLKANFYTFFSNGSFD